jgi:hypothetical protein
MNSLIKFSFPEEEEQEKEPKHWLKEREATQKCAPAANRTRGPSMATMDFTTKPLALFGVVEDGADIADQVQHDL